MTDNAQIIFISGACGSGKSTFADALARHLVRQDHKTVYVIHGDDFHGGFREPEEKGDFFVNGQASDQVLWEDILRFNWDCIISTAQRALQDNLDVVIDYVIEDELPRVQELAEKNRVPLYYIVLTADAEEIEICRGFDYGKRTIGNDIGRVMGIVSHLSCGAQ